MVAWEWLFELQGGAAMVGGSFLRICVLVCGYYASIHAFLIVLALQFQCMPIVPYQRLLGELVYLRNGSYSCV